MRAEDIDGFIRKAQAAALLGLPLVWLLMFALHFQSISQFFIWRSHYVPVPATERVSALIAAHNHWPMIHDPHWLGYLSLPALLLCSFGLYALGRPTRPTLAMIGLAMTASGTIFVGGVMGLFTALVRGLGDVDARYTDGAIATYAAATADHGAYGLTRTLAEFALLGILLQLAALWGAPRVARWCIPVACIGCLLFVLFWDVDNVMFLATICMAAAFVPLSRELRKLPCAKA
jgi:hypothetical protein